MHGYDLLSEYKRQEVADWASISKAQLYYALNKLEGLGLLEGDPQEGARERTVYRPTDAGRQALAEGLADTSWAEGRIAQPFATWFGLSMHAPKGAETSVLKARLEFLEQEIGKEERSLAYLATLTDPRALKGTRIVELTIGQLKVERDWVEALLAAG